MGKTKQQLIVDNNTSFPNNNANYITPALLRDFNRDMIDNTVNQDVYTADSASFNQRIGDLASWSSSLDTNFASQTEFNSYTASNNAKVNALITFTGSADSRLDALEAYTASDNSSISALNAFTQSADSRLDSLEAATSSYATSAITASSLTTASFAAGTLTFTKGDGSTFGVVIPDVSGSVTDLSALNAFTASVAGTNAFTQSIQTEVNGIEAKTGSFATTGSNLFDGSNTFINGQTTFYTPVVFQNVSSIQNYSGSTWNFGLSATTGSNYTLKSNPFDPVLLITRESDNAKPIQMDWRDNKVTLAESGAVEIAPSAFGGFKVNTTASFYGRNVWMIADGFTSSLAYVTASVSGSNSNLIFKNNALTTATIVSGSSNIFQSPAAASATFGRYIGGSNNIFITSGSVPQLTGSLSISPVMNGNIINGAGTIFMRTPVSSSAYTISHNTINGGNINFGSAAATSFVSASAGLNFTNNFSNATIQAVANKTTLVNAPNIQLNNLGGALVLNMDSSSIGFASNNLQGSLTINNLYSGSTAAGNFVSVANGLFVGSNYSLVASGSNTTLTTPRQFANNVMLGSAHSASANLLGDNSNLNSTALIGHGLNVTGSSALQTAAPQAADRGTVIVGRFNTDVLSNNTVFVVGTGTSTSSRRNGLLIDSGSNAFLSGSLNIVGNTTMTGSFSIQSGSAFPSATGSTLLAWNASTGQVTNTTYQSALPALFDAGAFYSTGSITTTANVSGSFTFDTTLNINSVTVTSGSRINVPKSGTYNIQFSTQIAQGSGDGNVAIWLKKNGANVADTATYIDVASNKKAVLALNLWDIASTNDYYELAYQSDSNNTTFQTVAATGNIPRSPSIILTINQIR